MNSSHARTGLCLVGLLTAPACTDKGSNDDESVGESAGESGYTSTYSDGSTDSGSTADDTTDSSTDESTSSDSTDSSSTDESSTDESSTDESSTDSGSTDSGSTDSGSTDSGSTDSSTDSTGGDAPSVLSTSPDDLASGVDADPTISVTFSEAMDGATLTTNTADTTCSGTLQVSADDFATCVRMIAAPASLDDLTFTVGPAAALTSATTYQIRVLAEASDAGGTPMGVEFTSANGFVVRYFHTITLDGINDFGPGETFVSSTLGHVGYVAWDTTYVYLGMNSPDLAGNSNLIWLVAYLGGPLGSPLGVTYNSQQPMLPFDALWHLRWRANDNFGGALEWNGATWINPGFGPNAGSNDVAFAGSFVEMRVAWANLDNPDLLDVHLGMLREQAFNEASWAAVPGSSYVDGYDPNYTKYFEFDVLGSTLPADHDPS